MSLFELVPILVVLVIIATGVWVFIDARTRVEEGNPVVLSVGPIQLDSPQAWAAACLFLWMLCLPLYLATRRPR